jgi:hypothetical protein
MGVEEEAAASRWDLSCSAGRVASRSLGGTMEGMTSTVRRPARTVSLLLMLFALNIPATVDDPDNVWLLTVAGVSALGQAFLPVVERVAH